MARRGYIGGGRQGFQINPIEFLRGGGGVDKDDAAMAMALMGYGKGTSPQDQALEAQKQAWAEKYQAGQLGIEELKQKAAEADYKSLAEARTAATTDAAQKRMDEAAKQAALEKYQAGQLDYLKSKAERDANVEVFKNLVEHGGLTEKDPRTGKENPQYDIYAEAAFPGYIEKKTAAKKALFEQEVGTKLAEYQALDPKKRAAVDKNPAGANFPPEIYSEVLRRANANAAQPGAPTAAGPGEGRLPLSSLNAPTAPVGSDIFSEKGVRIGPPLVDARDYGKFPGSVEDLIRASGQPQPESRFAQPAQSPAAATSAPSNFYQEGYPSAKPDYMYGIQTPVAMDVINKYANDPRFTPVEDELMQKVKDWWNRGNQPEAATSVVQMPQSVGYGRDDAGPVWQYGTGTQAIPQEPIAMPQVPGITVDDLLRKALQEKQAAAQEMPWLYGREGWPGSQALPGPTPLPRELLQ